MNGDLPPGRVLGQRARVLIAGTEVWTAASVEAVADGIPFTGSTHTLRIINVAKQSAVLIPFDRDGLEKLRIEIIAALDSHTPPTQ